MKIYLVGGAVRDQLLGYPVYDRDWVVTGATPNDMLSAGFRPVGKDFPVFLHPETTEEYALARLERKSGKGYNGFAHISDPTVTLEQDLMRRDLTINAMAQSDDGTLIDPYGGQQDLEARLLRHVSDAFIEDPLRVLRVARFAARYAHLGFKVADETMTLMHTLSAETDELHHLSKERVWQETERALNEHSPLTYLNVLNQCNALSALIPEWCTLLEVSNFETALRAFENITKPTSNLVFTLFNSIAFAQVSAESAEESLNNLCKRLRVPNTFKQTSLDFIKSRAVLSQFQAATAEDRLKMIQALDLLRRPERLAPVLDIAKALQLLDASTPDQLQGLLARLNAITPKELMAKGFKGKELGEALTSEKLKACASL